MEPLEIEGAWIYRPKIHSDKRGKFHEWFISSRIATAAGRDLRVAQANCSASRRGVIRGIHFSDVPPGQAKYVTCPTGAILDVIVDLRVGAPSFGHWTAVELSERNGCAVFISEGLGHAFASLTDDAKIFYLCSTFYDPHREHAVHPLDPEIGIEWPIDTAPILSDKDQDAPSLSVARADLMLPDYARCREFVNSLALS
ncbi:MAG TPA: dTDP-4-dehydrorhamnose 3,5-epimerase [Streptosporangiaceae bacterium]|jgi:dTDP-4-dehydrorhamnose 3,5-epimerase|nr:dTDP-4-dehydrorhamnose 3,5-epimerase [Streptosporangiaceae bacterium]